MYETDGRGGRIGGEGEEGQYVSGYETGTRTDRAYVGPADHVDCGKMHGQKGGMLDHLIGQVNAEGVARQTETEPHGAVFPAESDVRVEVEHRPVLTEIGFVGDCLDVILAVFDESAVSQRAAVLEESRGKPGGPRAS